MPGRDGRGPLGQGPRSGRGMGPCGSGLADSWSSQETDTIPGRFSRLGNFFRRRGNRAGSGRGQGRGRGRFNS